MLYWHQHLEYFIFIYLKITLICVLFASGLCEQGWFVCDTCNIFTESFTIIKLDLLQANYLSFIQMIIILSQFWHLSRGAHTVLQSSTCLPPPPPCSHFEMALMKPFAVFVDYAGIRQNRSSPWTPPVTYVCSTPLTLKRDTVTVIRGRCGCVSVYSLWWPTGSLSIHRDTEGQWPF